MPPIKDLGKLKPAELGILYKFKDEETAAPVPTEDIVMGANVDVVMRNSEKKLILRKYTKKFNANDTVFDSKDGIKIMIETIYREDLKKPKPEIKLLGINKMKDAREHAEMRILSYFKARSWELSEVGVSKPCCHKCADALEESRVEYTRWMEVTQAGDW